MTRSVWHFVLLLLVGTLTSTLASIPPETPDVASPVSATAAAEPADEAPEVAVTELDLAGVNRASLADLPAVAPEPVEELAVEVAPPNAPDPLTTAVPDPAVPADPGGTELGSPGGAATPEQSPTTSPATLGPAEPLVLFASAFTPAAASAAAPEGPSPDVLTAELDTAPFSVLGVTWDESPTATDVVIRYRVRQAGTWSEWEAVSASDIAPDAGSAEGSSLNRGATDAIVAIDADGLQVWAEAEPGRVTGLKAVLVDPGEDPGPMVEQTAGDGSPAQITTAALLPTAAATPPPIIRRAEWGADESLRTCEPDLSMNTVSAAVHHTASTNSYSAADVPGLLRGFMAYHTRPEAAGGRGWCDIGYNFLVDQFGRIFEGRAGSIEMPVVGVHTGGFNSRTIGVAAIGEYGAVAPSAALLEGVSEVIAWKFATYRIMANTNVIMVSGGGASKYPAGTSVLFSTIYGHRDAQLTSCPGQNLYDALADIRNRVAALANDAVRATPTGNVESLTTTKSDISVSGWVLDPEGTDSLDVTVTIDGVPNRITADIDRPDLATYFPSSGTRHGFRATIPMPGGDHVVCITAHNIGAGNDLLMGCSRETVANAPSFGSIDSVSATSSSISLVGWALDPDTTDPIQVHVYLDGHAVVGLVAADLRTDVGAAFGKGNNHGYTATFPATAGTHTVCVYAIDSNNVGPNPQLGCRSVSVSNKVSMGSIDAVAATSSSISLAGWALDPDTTDPIQVHVYLDGAAVLGTVANTLRTDVGAAFGKGNNHGYTATFPATSGTHTVCVYAIDSNNVGPNPQLGCRQVTSG